MRNTFLFQRARLFSLAAIVGLRAKPALSVAAKREGNTMPNRSNPLAFYLRLGAAVLAALLLAAGALRALLHLNDLAGSMTHVSGIWMALAQYLNDGIFYPPLHADGYYAGTRYMPVFFSLIAGIEHLTGNYLVAAKVVTMLAMAGLVTATVVAVWRTTRRPLDAVALGGLVLAFPEGLRRC